MYKKLLRILLLCTLALLCVTAAGAADDNAQLLSATAADDAQVLSDTDDAQPLSETDNDAQSSSDTDDEARLLSETDGDAQSSSDTDNEARLLSETQASGSCGNGMTWRLDVEGVFTVSGKGVMTDYDSANAVPWRKYRLDIDRVNIEYGVTRVGNYAFIGCTNLRAVTIPETMRVIGACAFSNCEVLTEIAISDGLREIGNLAFSGCSRMTSFPLPKTVTTLGQSAFSHCTGLTEFNITGTLDETRAYLFSGCTALRTVTLPDTVRTIGQRTFSGCTALEEIDIPEKVKVIGPYAFENCSALRTVGLPYNLTDIENGTFSGCASLASVTVPTSVKNIRQAAFSGCGALKDVYYSGTATQWNAISMVDFKEQMNKYFIQVHYGESEKKSDVVIESAEPQNSWLYVRISGNPDEDSTLFVAYYDENGQFLNLESYAVSYAGVYPVAYTDGAASLSAFVVDSNRRPQAAALQKQV